MNINEACSLLGVPVGSSMDDVSKAFKKMAIQYHPDKNKDEGAEAKFKEINTAYQLLQKHGTSPPSFNDIRSSFYDPSADFAEEINKKMNDLFNKQPSWVHFNIPINNGPISFGSDITITVELSFEESVLGCKKDISYTRNVKGIDNKSICQKCNGAGKRKYGVGAVKAADDRELPCNGCRGSGFIDGTGSVSKITENLSLKIPAGVENEICINLNGKGNYAANGFYKDLTVLVKVKPSDKGLTLVNGDVISIVELTLLEALKGTKKNLWTIKGEKVLEFKPKVKNGDRIRVSGFGTPPNGAHVFIVNIVYPDDVSEIIQVLEPKKSDDSAHS